MRTFSASTKWAMDVATWCMRRLCSSCAAASTGAGRKLDSDTASSRPNPRRTPPSPRRSSASQGTTISRRTKTDRYMAKVTLRRHRTTTVSCPHRTQPTPLSYPQSRREPFSIVARSDAGHARTREETTRDDAYEVHQQHGRAHGIRSTVGGPSYARLFTAIIPHHWACTAERGAGARTVHAGVDHHQTLRHGRIVVRVAAPPAARRGLHGDYSAPTPVDRRGGGPHSRAMIRSSPTGSVAH